MLNVSGMTCEHRVNPVGIDECSPRFSWIIESDKTEVMQRSYRILVATDQSITEIIWDSGTNLSERSVLIPYEGEPLKASTRYYWNVEVEDNHNETSSSESGTYFETGLLLNRDWSAAFISPAGEIHPEKSPGWYILKQFNVDSEVAFARLYSTALGVYEAFINGERREEFLLAPGWTNYKDRLLYQTFDISKTLRKGKNVVSAHVGSGWYKGDLVGWRGKRSIYGERIACSMVIVIRYENGREEMISTDETWHSLSSPVLYSELYHGEVYDARKEIDYVTTIDEERTEAVEAIKYDEAVVCAQDGPPVQIQETIRPVTLLQDTAGRTIIDFGQNLTGWVRFNVQGSVGSEVVLKHAEILTPEGDLYTENLRSARQEIRYILKGEGVEEYRPAFTFQGFRYVLVEKYPGEIDPGNFRAEVVYSTMPKTGDFTCSNELVNKLNENIHWGMKGNFLDIPTDCPQRDERLGWTGDAQVFISTACNLRDASGFFTKWLRDMQSEQNNEGGIPYVIPDVLFESEKSDDLLGCSHSATGWADAAVICPWEIYLQYSDERILKENYNMMKRWVEYIRHHAKDEVIWDTGFHMGDWLALDSKEGSYFGATPNDFTSTVFYANSADLLSRAAAVLGEKSDAEEYRSLFDRILLAFKDEFYTVSGRLAVQTQTAHVLALHFKLTPKEFIRRTVDDLVNLIESANGHLTTGFLGTPYICFALSQNGHLDTAYDLLQQEEYPSWLYPVKNGATTIWEHWDGIKPDGSLWSPDMNSFNHYAYGAVGHWLYTTVAGLNLVEEEPGYKIIDFRPQPGGSITSASMQKNTPYGKACIEWFIENGVFTVDLHVPCNTSARLTMPGQQEPEVLGSGQHRRMMTL